MKDGQQNKQKKKEKKDKQWSTKYYTIFQPLLEYCLWKLYQEQPAFHFYAPPLGIGALTFTRVRSSSIWFPLIIFRSSFKQIIWILYTRWRTIFELDHFFRSGVLLLFTLAVGGDMCVLYGHILPFFLSEMASCRSCWCLKRYIW